MIEKCNKLDKKISDLNEDFKAIKFRTKSLKYMKKIRKKDLNIKKVPYKKCQGLFA